MDTLRQQAMRAWVAKDWPRAEALLTQVLAAYPKDRDMRGRLQEVRRQLALLADQVPQPPAE